jgi:phosphonate transport system substrate-binding protein
MYVKTHTNTYRHVLLGKAAAGGGVNSTLSQEPEDVRANLRILLETPGVPPHPLSVHPRVPAKVHRAVVDAILKMAADPSAKDLLSQIQMPNPVRADYAKDYLPLEKYRLEKYVVR